MSCLAKCCTAPSALVIRVQPTLARFKLRLRGAEYIKWKNIPTRILNRKAVTVQQRGVRIKYLSDLERVNVNVERLVDLGVHCFVSTVPRTPSTVAAMGAESGRRATRLFERSTVGRFVDRIGDFIGYAVYVGTRGGEIWLSLVTTRPQPKPKFVGIRASPRITGTCTLTCNYYKPGQKLNFTAFIFTVLVLTLRD